ncbi:MAG: DUF3299 domain-containing protein [Cellvibrionaceae bacterium]|nr:DUF3299 domain-containing protein [Cellvibrionaceae bacterium]
MGASHQFLNPYPIITHPRLAKQLTQGRLAYLLYPLLWLLLCYCPSLAAKEFTPVEWVELIPQSDLDALLNPPASLNAIVDGSPEDRLPADPLANAVENAIKTSQDPLTPQEEAYYAALKSTNINADLDGRSIRIPGFIVPVEYNDDQVITEFFLVPYFGACIHVPPPPPNQIIYIKYPQGLELDALYDPFWIEGELRTSITQNDLAIAAYAITAEHIKPYSAYRSSTPLRETFVQRFWMKALFFARRFIYG